MNSYFGIGIDAKITLDFHMKREEHPEKCRSRARNYMWYGVLGSKEWLQVSLPLSLSLALCSTFDAAAEPLKQLWGSVYVIDL